MLKIEALEAGYRGSRVLAGLDLEVPEGRVTALLGRNGMGKTTLLRALIGLVPVSAGTVIFAGRPITGLKPYEISNLGMAYVPQGREIFADFTVEENLRMGTARARSRPRPTRSFRSWPNGGARGRGPCPAVSSSNWRSPGLWWANRGCSCWTNPPKASSPRS
jgi:ABC-type branched-subunit amino acid transport system ATPase component